MTVYLYSRGAQYSIQRGHHEGARQRLLLLFLILFYFISFFFFFFCSRCGIAVVVSVNRRQRILKFLTSRKIRYANVQWSDLSGWTFFFFFFSKHFILSRWHFCNPSKMYWRQIIIIFYGNIFVYPWKVYVFYPQ